MKLSLSYFDQSTIEEVPLDLWRELFDAVGWPSSLEEKKGVLTYEDVMAAIGDEPSNELLLALEAIYTLGTEAGREAITSIMVQRQVQIQALPEGASERELAIRLYIEKRHNTSLSDVFERARIQVQENGDHRRYNEFLGIEPRPVKSADSKKETLRSAVLRHCQESDLGNHVQVTAFEEDNVYRFSIMRTDRLKKPLAVQPGQENRVLIQYRPVHCDLLRYEADLGRLRIFARSPSMVEFYRSTLGEVLFGESGFFTRDPVNNLSVLQKRGSSALEDHGVFGISRVRMVECTWECGDRDLMVLRGTNCFNLIEQYGLSITAGTLLQAKLKVDVIRQSTRPVTVNLRPNRVEVSQPAQEPLIDELLEAIGIRTVSLNILKTDLWALHPWRHPLPVWRNLFGNLTDALVKQGSLLRTQLGAVPHPEFPGAGNVLRVHAVDKSEFQGVSELPEIPSRSLSATDVEALELMPESFRQYLRTTLCIASGGATWKAGDDILELGYLPIGNEQLYVVYALRAPSSNVSDRLRTRIAGAHVVLLVPVDRAVQEQGATVVIDGPIPSREQVIHDGVFACGIANSLPAIYRAPSKAQLVVDSKSNKVWVYGVEIPLTPGSHAFLFVEMLASNNGGAVTAEAITRALSPERLNRDGTTVARQAKTEATKVVKKALTASGMTAKDDLFPTQGTGSYRCALLPFVG